MYQNVSGKSIENQELILRIFLLCIVAHFCGNIIQRPPITINPMDPNDNNALKMDKERFNRALEAMLSKVY